MQVQLSKPEIEKFIDEQVKAGLFPTAQAAVEAAIERMMSDVSELDDDVIAAIARADEQYDRREFVEWRSVRDDLRKKYLNK